VSEEREGEAGSTVAGTGWYLEFVDEGGALQRKWIHTLPFRIGRRHGLDLVLPAESVSKEHAEIYAVGSTLRLRDLGSVNGTYLNRSLLEDDAALAEGDVLHFADFEFRLGHSDRPGATPAPPARERPTTAARQGHARKHFQEGTRQLRELLDEPQLSIVAFQPIILLSRGTVVAYEALGRGRHPKLPESPLDLLRIAEDISEEAKLSRLFRRRAVELAVQRPDLFPPGGRKESPTIFLNTHPGELAKPGLIESLDELRAVAPSLDLALEIHESVLTSPSAIAELRTWLTERNIALAYDDFGAGRAHLLELAEAPPHYLKFDRRFVEDLDKSSAGKRRMLRSLLLLAEELRIRTVAEGIETEAEQRACTEIGFTHGQGFHIGRPKPLDEM
jgi:EAL domain-containing protein (putative c-di-GMP-specific phosphodiesterase class I)